MKKETEISHHEILKKDQSTYESNTQINSEYTNFERTSISPNDIKREDHTNLVNSFITQKFDQIESTEIPKSQKSENKKAESVLKDNTSPTLESNFDYKDFYLKQKRYERNTVSKFFNYPTN